MRKIAGQFARYVVTGGTAAVVDIGGFAVLIATGLAILPSAIASFAAAVVVNYALTSRFVFGKAPSGRSFGLFVVGAIVGLSVNVGVTVAAHGLAGLAPVLAKVVGVGIAFVVNFALNAGFVFRNAPPAR